MSRRGVTADADFDEAHDEAYEADLAGFDNTGLDNADGDLLAEVGGTGNGRLPGGTMTGQRQTRPGTPRMNGTDSFDEALDDDGELETADWEQLEEEDPVSEPAAIIDEILAARSNPSGDHDDGDENADAPAAAVVAAAEDPDADEDDDPEDPLLAPVRACGEDEFICQGCWLIKRRSQRTGTGDRCRDCD